MIYVVNRQHTYTVQAWLDSEWGKALSDRVRILSYQELPHLDRLPLGTWVFSDHERLTPTQFDLASSVWHQLAAERDRVRLFNHPTEVLTRYPLLCKLHDCGRNAFRAYRASETKQSLRFPVFVREEHDHTGGLTDLLHDRESLDRALRKLTAPWSKYRLRDLLVIEFCDTSDKSGLFRKYSAFRVSDRILARYLDHGEAWMVKGHTRRFDDDAVAEEWDYVSNNPHEDWVRESFDLAQIDYGRMDYGILDGEPQVWEINTNPRIGPPPWYWGETKRQIREDLRLWRERTKKHFHDSFRTALEAIDMAQDPDASIELHLDRGLRRRLLAERLGNLARELRRRTRRRLRKIFRRPEEE